MDDPPIPAPQRRESATPGTDSLTAGRLPVARGTGLRRRRARTRGIVIVRVDAAMLALAVAVSSLAQGEHVAPTGWTGVYVVLVLGILLGRGSYRTRLQASIFDHVSEVLVATALAASFVVTARVIAENDAGAAAETVRLWGFAATYLGAGRLGFNIATHSAHRRGQRTVVVGAGVVGQSVARRLLDRPEMGLRPVGFLDANARELADGLPPVLGASADLDAVVAEHDIAQLVITFSLDSTPTTLGLIRRARELGVEVAMVPRYFEEVNRRLTVEHVGGVAMLRVSHVDPKGWQFEVKYAIDRVVAAVVLLPLLPLFAVVALLVRLSSPGPILFRQDRMGRDGRMFRMLKFRTMRVGPPGQENDAAWAAQVLGREAPVAQPGTDRRTRIGTIMRRFSLDELPQLLNVLRGDMSLVGPRPERLGYARLFGTEVYRYDDRHRVKSGLTGWAQVQGLRGETSLQDRIEWDNYYVENWSPWLDLKIALLTPMAVLGKRGTGF